MKINKDAEHIPYGWLPYATEHYEHSWCLKKAADLRLSGKYYQVRVSGTISENGIKYSKIFVILKEEICQDM